MRISPLPLALLVACALYGPAKAGDVCRFENGAVVVSADMGGVAGDYILDPSAPHSLMHDTRAQAAGFAATDLVLAVRLDGQRVDGVEVTVTDLDARSAGFQTPIAGVIGADVLAGHVLDLALTPTCRLGFYRPGRAPRFRAAMQMPVRLAGGIPAVEAMVSDGTLSGVGLFALDTGSAADVRLSARLAETVPALTDPDPRNGAPARLRMLSFAGRTVEAAPAAVAAGLDPALSGALGNGVWSGWKLRLDMARRRLLLAPKD